MVGYLEVIGLCVGFAVTGYRLGYRRGTADGAQQAARAWGDAFYDTALAKYAEWPSRPQ